MSKLIALTMLIASLLAILAGCETKDPHEPNLKGPPDPRYPRPGVSMGGGSPPPPPAEGKTDEAKGGESGKTDETKAGDEKAAEEKEGEKGPGASAGAG